jgi:hypothetical protein
MKRCQKCNRTFPDENQKFCTFDGGLLLADQSPSAPFNSNPTVRPTSKDLEWPPGATRASEAKTNVQLPDLKATIASFGSATLYEAASSPTGAPTSSDVEQPAPTVEPLVEPQQLQPPPPAPPVAPRVESQHLQPPPPVEPPVESQQLQPTPAAPAVEPPVEPRQLQPTPPAPAMQPFVLPPQTMSSPLPRSAAQPIAPPKKKSMWPWVLAILVVLLFLSGGAAAAGYFLWLKPLMETKKRQPVVIRTEPSPTATPSSFSSPAKTEIKEKPAPFEPPPDALKLTNSKANLDGELAAHYVDFSFYYPRTWKKDPNAGMRGASSFAKVEREFSDKTADYVQERVVVRPYQSNGTYELDLPIFKERAKAVSDQISKSLPNYEEVSSEETKVNSLRGYEFRFQGVFKNTGRGDLPYWGRVIFVPPDSANEKNGVTIIMLATSLVSDVHGVNDVGVKGESPLILESFRFGPGS